MASPTGQSFEPHATVMNRPVRRGLPFRQRLADVLEFVMEIATAAE